MKPAGAVVADFAWLARQPVANASNRKIAEVKELFDSRYIVEISKFAPGAARCEGPDDAFEASEHSATRLDQDQVRMQMS